MALKEKIHISYLGFAPLWACNLICFQSTMIFMPSVASFSIMGYFFAVSLLISVLTHITAAVFFIKFPEILKKPRVLIPGFIITCGIIVASLVAFLPEINLPLLVLGGILTGLGNGILDTLWSHFYGTLRPERSGFYIPLSIVLAVLLYFLGVGISHLSPLVGIIYVAGMPLISAVMLQLNLRKVRSATVHPLESRNVIQTIKTLWQAVVGAVIFSTVFGIMEQLTVNSSMPFNDIHTIALVGNALGAFAFFVLMRVFKTRFDVSNAYRIAAPFLILGFLILPLASDNSTSWANALVSTGCAMFDLVICCLVAETAYDYRVSGAIINGFTRGITIGASAFGTLIGYFLATQISLGGVGMTALVISALYLLLIAALVIIKRRHLPVLDILEEQDNETPGSENTTVPREARIALVAKEHHLSRRETEIFGYVAHGRSAIYIATTLTVSQNTVRSHMRRIYEKLEVHSKQELLDLIEIVE